MTNFQRGFSDLLLKIAQQASATPNLDAVASSIASAGSELADPTYDAAGEHVVGPKYALRPLDDRIASFKDKVNPQIANAALGELGTVGMPAFSNILNRASAGMIGPSANKGAWQLWDSFANGYLQDLASNAKPVATNSVASASVPEYTIPPSDDPNYEAPSD